MARRHERVKGQQQGSALRNDTLGMKPAPPRPAPRFRPAPALATLGQLIEQHGISRLRAWATYTPAFVALPRDERGATRQRIAGPVEGWTPADLAMVRTGVIRLGA